MTVSSNVVNQVVSGTVVFSVPPSVAPAALMSPEKASGVSMAADTDCFTNDLRLMGELMVSLLGFSRLLYNTQKNIAADASHSCKKKTAPASSFFTFFSP